MIEYLRAPHLDTSTAMAFVHRKTGEVVYLEFGLE